MRRYFIETPFIEEHQRLLINGDLYHHIFSVCRNQQGHEFELLNNSQKAFRVKVLEIRKKEAEVEILQIRQIGGLPTPHIHLVVAVPKLQTLETIIEKAVELGVKAVHPVFSDYSFLRDARQYPAQKQERWQKIIRHATEQSGRGDLMEMPIAIPLEDWLKKNLNRNSPSNSLPLCLFAYEGGAERSVRDFLQEKKENAIKSNAEVFVFVGSEGGFSLREFELMKKLDLEPVSLGEQILRVETACVTLVSAIKYEFDLFK